MPTTSVLSTLFSLSMFFRVIVRLTFRVMARMLCDNRPHTKEYSLDHVAHGREFVERPNQIHSAIEDELLEHDPSPFQVVLLVRKN